jgi:Tol biopolymer transport system component
MEGEASSALSRFAPGAQLGPYRIEAALGAGGMGVVYRALDIRLGRQVAIKICRGQFSGRFEREARAVSALNHPHICILHDVGPDYLVMELVEGETLAARLKQGALPMKDVLRYGTEIADALAAAHQKGIVHRDLKPANIMLTKSGVKVLDFGLAKLTAQADETVTMTDVAAGTPAYMAPEQFEGRDAGGQTDIYALGLVLFEMATGRRLSPGAPVEAGTLPPQFAHVVERCLAREPESRWQSAADIAAELAWIADAPAQTSHGNGARKWKPAAAVIAGAVLLAAAYLALRRPAAPRESVVRFPLVVDGQLDEGEAPAPSPDGRYLAAAAVDSSGKRRIWLRSLEEAEGRWLAGTEDAGWPFWSGDGRWIGFHAQGRIKKVSPSGGSPQSILETPGVFMAAWNGLGDLIFAPNNRSQLYRAKESGGAAQPLTRLDTGRTENSHRWPLFLPDGRHFLFIARSTDARQNALYIGSLDSGETRRLMTAESQVADVPGALLFVREGTLFRQSFDGNRLSGEPVAVAEHVANNPISVQADFGASHDGRVLLVRSAGTGGNSLTWFQRNGAAAGILGTPGVYFDPRISPDGRRVLFDRPDGDHGNRDLWTADTTSGVMFRLTTNPANDLLGIWSPDGREIVFGSDRGGGPVLEFYRKSAEVADAEMKLNFGLPPDQFDLMDWSRDGAWAAFHGHSRPVAGLLVASMDGARKASRVSPPAAREFFPRFSPDGQWIAYASDESGRSEVHVRRFHGVPGGGNPSIQVSNNGGGHAVWSKDGAELFYLGSDFKLYAVRTRDLRPGALPASTALFTACPDTQPLSGPLTGYPYDTAPDGRFLFICRPAARGYVVTVKQGGR